MSKVFDLTVVIPTIGEKNLFKTIFYLNNGKFVPKKIIIVVHKTNFLKINNKILNIKNVTVIKTQKKGQVFQRYTGFKKAKTKYVMQLDADCIIKTSSITKMISIISREKKICVGPCFIDEKNFLSIHKFENEKSLFNSFKNIILGFPAGLSKMGSVSKSATNFGVDHKFLKKNQIEVSWIPGGCMMHRRENLIKKNFYPFEGKAYCEDLIHCNLLKKKNIKLFILKKCFCITSFPEFPNKFKDLLGFIKAYIFTAKMYQVYTLRLFLCIVLYFARYLKFFFIK